jgi:uncharacterized protein (TIGR03083 family)
MSEPSPVAVSAVEPIGHAEGCRLAETAYARFADAVEQLQPDDWTKPSDCEGWTVRDLVGHMVGALRAAASTREFARQQLTVARRARGTDANTTDLMTAIQLESTAGLRTDELAAECRALGGPATAGRRRTPAPLRRLVRFSVPLRDGPEQWNLGYLVDVILTRDAWLHRIDLCRAVEVEPLLTPAHDGRIVADVVAEWARRHGQPFHLVLRGPAGGAFVDRRASVEAIEPMELDAVELCRILSGRAPGTGLLATEVPF